MTVKSFIEGSDNKMELVPTAGYTPCPCQSTTGGVGNRPHHAEAALKEREPGCLLPTSRGPYVTGNSQVWAE